MYILLNKETLAIPYKSANPYLLCNLAWIEVSATDYTIAPADYKILRGLNLTQLATLYKNVTGSELTVTGLTQIWAEFVKVFEVLPITDADADEVNQQASLISDELRGLFLYCKGATKPVPGNASNADALLALIKNEKTVIRKAAPSEQRVKEGGQLGSVKAIIWKVADEVWAENGSPLAKEMVLKVRKTIMDLLEVNHNIKRTSASSELGNWHKTRAPY